MWTANVQFRIQHMNGRCALTTCNVDVYNGGTTRAADRVLQFLAFRLGEVRGDCAQLTEQLAKTQVSLGGV